MKFNMPLALFLIVSGSQASHAETTNRSTSERWNKALVEKIGADEIFTFIGDQRNVRAAFIWWPCGDYQPVGGAHPTVRGGSREAYQIAQRVLDQANFEKRPSEPNLILDDLLIDCTPGVETDHYNNLPARWNRAIALVPESLTFEFLGEQRSVRSYFMWQPCDLGNLRYGGAHPTHLGGSSEAYRIAKSVLETVNEDPFGDNVTLDDLSIECRSNTLVPQ